jgi:glycogen(starch) synthase
MKVLMYGWEFPPNISGGLGVACYGIVQSLLNLGVNCTLVLPHMGDELINQDERFTIVRANTPSGHFAVQSIDALLRPYQTDVSYQLFYNKMDSSSKKKIYGENLWAEIYRYADSASQIAAKHQHDVIHAHDWLTILAGVKAKEMSGKPLIFHVHALEIDRSGAHCHQAVFDIEKFGMEQADVIIAVSQFTKNIIMQHYGIAEEKIAVVHNGVFKPSSEVSMHEYAFKPRPIVLFLGRVTHQKGPCFFIEAAKKILSKRQDIEFIIAGEGDQLPHMIETVAAEGISGHVHFTGFLDQDAVNALYMISDIYVMPSVSEPFGIACLEALSHDLPVIISKQSGVSEVLHHALKIDYWDVDALVEKIIALIDFPALRDEMLQHNQKELERLSWHSAGKKIKHIYEGQIVSLFLPV